MNAQLVRDSAERIGVTAALAAIGVAVTELAGWSEWWAVALAAALNLLKVALASRFGDPNTGGFVTEGGGDGSASDGIADAVGEGWDEGLDEPVEPADDATDEPIDSEA